MKKSSVVISVFAGLLVVGLIIVALLPGIMSSDRMKPFVLQKVNAQLPGQLQVEKWSVGWFGGIVGRGIAYDNRQDDLFVQVAELKIEKGLLGLILAGGNPGAVEIIDPTVIFYLAEKTAGQDSKTAAPTTPSPETTPAEKQKAVIPAFYGKLILTGGTLMTATAEGNEKTRAKNIDLLLDAPGPQHPITYRFSAESGDGSGRASAEGILVLDADNPLNMQKFQSNSKLSINNWPVEDVFDIIAARAGFPSAKGRLNADVSLTGSSAESLHLIGQMAMAQLQLRDGPLGSDAPTVKDILIDLDAAGNNNSLSLKNLTFRSSLANGSATGRFDDQNQRRLAGQADVDLAEMFSQFPATLQLREGTKITKGKMALSANIETTRARTSFDGDARIDRLQGISAGKKISWNKPVTVNARGQMRPEGLQLDNLSLRSSFLKADGRGDMRNMRVDLSADLKAALAELRKFIQIKQWDGSGKLKLNLNLNAKTENLNHATLKLNIDDFVLSRNRRPILARQNIRMDLTTDIKVAEIAANSKLLQPVLNIQSSVIRGTVKAERVEGTASNRFPNAAGLNLDGNINLQQLSSMLQNLNILSADTRLGGQSAIKISADLKEGQLVLDNIRVDTQKFLYRQDKKIIKEDRIILTTRGSIDLNRKSMRLAPVDIDGQAGKIHIPELAITDWTHAQRNMKINGRADLDLNRLAQGYGDFMQLPEKTDISGNGQFDFDVDFSNPKKQYLKLQGNVAPFKLVSKTLPAVSEKKVTLNVDLTRSPDGRNVTINKVDLNSNALSLKATGTLNQVGKNKVLNAKGTMTPDLKLVSDYLKKSGQSQVAFSGKKATPFTIKLVSKGDRWEDPLKHLDFSGAVHVTAIEAYGLKLTPNDVPIRIAGAAAGAKLESPANGGQLNFQPTIDMRKEPYILSFNENIDLLKDVQVTQGLIDGLLAAIHPLFKDAVIPDGLLGLNMKHFNWPLSEKERNKATFAGTLQLNGIRLNSTPFMAGLLNMMGISERQLSLADQEIDFEAKNGRIALSPMTLDAEGYQLKMHGSIGFDKTLDFIARLPVTKKMVGKDAYRFLQGMTIKVPIRGTASKPRIDEAAFQEATGDLMQQALRKNLQNGVQDLLKNLFKKSE